MPDTAFTGFINVFSRNPLSTILGGCITMWLVHRLTYGRDILADRRVAGRVIAEAFHSELNSLIQTDDDARLILTDDVFNKHDATIRDNIRRLSWAQEFRLRRAWYELAYYKIDNKNSIPFYTMYSDCGSLDKRREMRPLAIQRIQKIISIVE